MTSTIWVLLACFFLGGLVGAQGAGESDGKRLSSAFLVALVMWCAIGLAFTLYALMFGRE